MLSANGDQAIYLPTVDLPENESCRLEIELESHEAASTHPRPLEAFHPNSSAVY
jgi:hypothetical protein